MPFCSPRACLLVAMLLAVLPVQAEEDALPEPLTLAAALARADVPVPELQAADAESAAALATVREAESRLGLRAGFEGRLRAGQPLSADYSRNDSSLVLVVRRRLTDFGRTAAAREAGEQNVRAAEIRRRWARWQHRLDILDAYLDVLLADRRFRIADERMAILYVRLDAVRDRHRLGNASDVELLELESRYQQGRIARLRAEAEQRLARARLAEQLGVPGQLPGELAEAPDPAPSLLDLPPLEVLEREVLSRHPLLLALRAELAAAEQRVAEASATNRPDLFLEAGAGDYARAFGSRNRWHAGVVLSVPLATGGVREAALARARAARDDKRAEIAAVERDLRLELRALLEDIGIQRARREAADVRLEYRDLYLERSRALYELEVQTDLGDAMIELNDALREQEEARHALLRSLARLDALRGREPLAEMFP